ncbi:phage head-tail connector protein [Streptomyces antarcticus]|uniref:phage head-tail connector protein n=1 Tax=Streptomyces antarcticus TaxID=2996458 RepID=UPI0022706589|nr:MULTISPECIES: phage head-tail connector protein [unclassified Streptomyces]MCY0943538.1 phage gp6-like head-tail connector protein [Streptomyces sp. H34-AA3]MCZ4083553.1 phage gp6-like head-tail connector protein [Streptomyces sp. H34-S5]
MANEYADLGTLKRQLGLDDDDDTRDALLQQALTAASRSIDKAAGRRFWLDSEPVQRVYRPHGRTVVEADGTALLVDDIGSTSGLVIETGSAAAWSVTATWETLPDNALTLGRPVTALLRSGGWGTGTSRVRVTARYGWPAVPDEIVQAALIQASRLFKRKDSPEGITGSAEWGVVRLSRRDPDVWNLIEPYLLPGFG